MPIHVRSTVLSVYFRISDCVHESPLDFPRPIFDQSMIYNLCHPFWMMTEDVGCNSGDHPIHI
jgi:hypothetical protein